MRAAAAVGAEYAGVDLLADGDGKVYVLEVNGIPGWQGLQEATGIDVAGGWSTISPIRPGDHDRPMSRPRRSSPACWK